MDISTKLDARYELHRPSLDEFATVVKDGLKNNFSIVDVDVVDCPDLSEAPFHLAASGFGGSPRIADVGGPGNLFPQLLTNKIYCLRKICELVGLPRGFAIGPGAGPYHKVGVNCEMMANYCSNGHGLINKTLIARVDPDTGSCVLETVPDATTEFALMVNLLISEGKPGKVVRVRAKTRSGPDNFITAMRKALMAKYGDKPVGVGGVFLIKSGKAKIHIMPDFPKDGFPTKEQIENGWLRYMEMKAPLVCLSVFHSHDPGHNLRVEHTHCFSEHGEGGHYHYDVTPETVEYEGYFTLAEEVYRIDKMPF
jgi:hypothetical protein